MEPWLSILITYYDEAELLRECVDSLGMIPEGVEVLVHDDCSLRWPARDFAPDGVRVIRSENNVGPGPGRNRLLAMALGRFVHFHDADDRFLPQFSAQILELCRNSNADMLISDFRLCRAGEVEEKALRWTSGVPLLQYLLLPERALLVPCVTWRRLTLQELGGFDARYEQSEDFELFLRAALAGLTVERVDLDLAEVRVRAESRSLRIAEVYRDALAALSAQEHALRVQAADAAAEKVAFVGALLYRMGEKALALNAFALSRRLGRPSLSVQSKSYRACARWFGLRAAEAIRAFQHRFRTPV